MINFLSETKEEISDAGYTPEQIVFIGSLDRRVSCSWLGFQLSADFEYNNSYGDNLIPLDLEIIFNDGARLIREEYDGAENWRFLKALDAEKIKWGVLTF